MSNEQLFLLFIKLILGFISAFFAVLLWSKSRESSWLFVVVGVFFLYGEIVFETLEYFGIADFYIITAGGFSLLKIVFAIVPFLCFAFGFMFFLLAKRGRF